MPYYDTDYARVKYLPATDCKGPRLAVTAHSPIGVCHARIVEGRRYEEDPGQQAERLARHILGLSPEARLARVFIGEKEDLFLPILES